MTTAFPRQAPTILPPPELREAFPELDKACAELERLAAERRAVRRDLEAATSDRRRAEVGDIAAAAEAHRAGKADPGSPGTDAVDARIRDLKRKDAVLSSALEGASADLADVIDRHRAEWTATAAQSIGKQRERVAKHAEAWGTARLRVAELESLSRWLAGFPARPSYTSPVLRMHGTPGTFTDLLDALLIDAEGPRAEEQAA